MHRLNLLRPQERKFFLCFFFPLERNRPFVDQLSVIYRERMITVTFYYGLLLFVVMAVRLEGASESICPSTLGQTCFCPGFVRMEASPDNSISVSDTQSREEFKLWL